MNRCYLDVETTGLVAGKNEIIQLACIFTVDGKEIGTYEWKCQPTNWDEVHPQAITTHGMTVEDLKEFPLPALVCEKFLTILEKAVELHGKFYLCGYCVYFDKKFVEVFLHQHVERNYDDFFLGGMIDGIVLFKAYKQDLKVTTVNNKLVTACDSFGIHIDAHDALSDIQATRTLIELLEEKGVSNVEKAMTDKSTMEFGKYRGKKLEDVPVDYLHWLWNNGMKEESHKPLHGYIKTHMNVLKKENSDLLWDE